MKPKYNFPSSRNNLPDYDVSDAFLPMKKITTKDVFPGFFSFLFFCTIFTILILAYAS